MAIAAPALSIVETQIPSVTFSAEEATKFLSGRVGFMALLAFGQPPLTSPMAGRDLPPSPWDPRAATMPPTPAEFRNTTRAFGANSIRMSLKGRCLDYKLTGENFSSLEGEKWAIVLVREPNSSPQELISHVYDYFIDTRNGADDTPNRLSNGLLEHWPLLRGVAILG
jgi:hypothetical protein